MKTITFITGNIVKAEQLQRHLSIPLLHQKIDLPEMQSLDLAEVSKYKSQEAFDQLKTPVLVEDTSLIFMALGKLPGTFIKWFLRELDNDGLCKLLNNYNDRSALAEVNFTLYDGKSFTTFDGSINGTIAKTPKGERGFGWDPIFIPKGYTKTWGEMSIEEQKMTSMRRIALKKLETYLTKSL